MNPRIPHRVRFVPEHERIQIDTTYHEPDEFDASELFDPTSPPMPMPEIELNSDNDLLYLVA